MMTICPLLSLSPRHALNVARGGSARNAGEDIARVAGHALALRAYTRSIAVISEAEALAMTPNLRPVLR